MKTDLAGSLGSLSGSGTVVALVCGLHDRQLGNFPQAFSHLALVGTALNLGRSASPYSSVDLDERDAEGLTKPMKKSLPSDYVESIQITMAERFGVQRRGVFCDETGAIRDGIQNHLLQVVGFLAMEHPATTSNEAIRDELAKVFRQVRPVRPEQLVRGQFVGYLQEPGVAEASRVETYAALRLDIASWRWQGVPFFIRAGKRLPITTTQILVQLKRPPLSGLVRGRSNYLRLQLTHELTIDLGALIKQPGEGMTAVPIELSLVRNSEDEMTPYERLLGDAIVGDATLFSSSLRAAA